VTVDPYSGEPVYLQIAAALRAQIASGEIPPRTFLPSLKTISERYEVARMTAERAVGVLRGEGLVRGIPGRGVYVIPEAERGPVS
jgi:DNA-binding GntR family transcriptional regulator